MLLSTVPVNRRITKAVKVGTVSLGGGHAIAVQSMTNTDTSDIKSTVKQIIELNDAGSELVRITIDRNESAQAVPYIKEQLDIQGYGHVPIIGDFHYIGHKLLSENPDCAQMLDKYRINPGNVGFGRKRDAQFATMIEVAMKYDKPVRIGVNWGSLDQKLLAKLLDANNEQKEPKPLGEITRQALIQSALDSAAYAESLGMGTDKIILACKVSGVQDLISLYKELAERCNYALHVGLTEAGMGYKGVVATSAALSQILQLGIGDTIRASLTPEPGEARTKEVKVCQELLQSMGLRMFAPSVTACPGCGRTTSQYFQTLAQNITHHINELMPVWRNQYPGVESLKVAVMGCVVNGPGESKHANIGISLPGTGEAPVAPVFIDGKKVHTLRGDNISAEFMDILNKYVQETYSDSKTVALT